MVNATIKSIHGSYGLYKVDEDSNWDFQFAPLNSMNALSPLVRIGDDVFPLSRPRAAEVIPFFGLVLKPGRSGYVWLKQ